MSIHNTDYLKYWRIVKRYIMKKHKISISDLEMILFLKSEMFFGNDEFDEYAKFMNWEKNRAYRMCKDGLLVVFREYDPSVRQRKLYKLSHKANAIINDLYKTLEKPDYTGLTKHIPKNKRGRYTDMLYREYMKKLNEETKRLRHLALE